MSPPKRKGRRDLLIPSSSAFDQFRTFPGVSKIPFAAQAATMDVLSVGGEHEAARGYHASRWVWRDAAGAGGARPSSPKARINRRSRRGLEGSYATESQWISAGNAGARLRPRPELHH